jgi:hypothetical protein
MRGVIFMRWVACSILLLLPASAFADGIKTLADGEILRGDFVQERLLQGFNAPLRSEGSFVLAPGMGLIWRVEKPFAITTLMTDRGLAQQSDGTTTLNLPASRAPFMAGLYDMLTGALAGDWSGLERDFTLEKSGGADIWHLRLVPRKDASTASMPIVEIRVTGADFVQSVEIEKQGGDIDKLSFADQRRLTGPLAADELTLLDSVGGP